MNINKSKYFIFLGPPGGGKGTQAKRLAKKLGYFYFGMGDLLRQEAKKKTPLGQKFQAILDKGQGGLISDQKLNNFLSHNFSKLAKYPGIVFDGVPRTLYQAEHLATLLRNNINQTKVINLEVSDNLLIERIQTRRVCQQCEKIFFQPKKLGIHRCYCGGKLIQRDEDKVDVFIKRLAIYNQETKPIIDYYQKQGILLNINGDPSIDQVWEDIQEKLSLD